MKKLTVLCPICRRHFDPRVPHTHIQQYHKNASDHDLKKILIERRKCFGQPKPKKETSVFMTNMVTVNKRHLPNTAK